jgi:glycosyltransferase involved in cell wall biosynthesis
MRILSTLTFYHPHWTGLTVLGRRLAEGMAARGHDVTVLTSRHEARLPRHERLNDVEVIRVPVLARVSRTVVMPSLPVHLVREIVRCDVVHLHTPMPEAPLVSGLARLLGKPTLITHHGDVVMPSAGASNRVVQRVMDAVLRVGMEWSDRIVVHVDDYRDHSAFLAPMSDKVGSILPPVVLPVPRFEEVRRLRRKLDLEGRPVVGFAGRFVEEKGFDFLLAAIPRVRERYPDVRFVYAGETAIGYERFFDLHRGSYEAHRDAIVELGLIRDPQRMAEFYALCDVFTLPSRTDCFAIVQVEALLAGTPLVTSDIPGAREVVRRTGAGTLVPPGSPPALAEGIIRVLEDGGRYRAATASAAEVFDPERSLGEYEALMAHLGGRRPRRPTDAGAGREVHT